MSENNTATSGANANTSGLAPISNVEAQVPLSEAPHNAEQSTSGDAKQGDVEAAKAYPAHFVDKLKREKDNAAKRLHDLQAQLKTLEEQARTKQESELQEKEQYKTLWEQEKQRAQEVSGKLDGLKNQMVDARKRSAIKEHLLKLGLNPQHEKTAFRLMDSSTVIFDDETQSIVGAEEAARSFHDQFKDLGIFGKTVPGVSHQAPVSEGNIGKSYDQHSPGELARELAKTLK